MKAIQLRNTQLRIPFTDENGEEKAVLHFDRSDENIKRIMNFEQEFEEITKDFKGKEDNLDAQKEVLEKVYDSLLEEGAFSKLYEINKSTIVLSVYLLQIAIGIKEELEAEDLKAVEAKYLK